MRTVLWVRRSTSRTRRKRRTMRLSLWLPVAPRVEHGAYKITISELGPPPNYSGETSLTIRPQDRRVLMLPAIDLGQSTILETVVLIQYKTRDEDELRFDPKLGKNIWLG